MNTQRLTEYDCFFCDVCRMYVYDESLGDPQKGLAARTLVDTLPWSWCCPVCGAPKNSLRASTLANGFVHKEKCSKLTENTKGKEVHVVSENLHSPDRGQATKL